MAATRLFVRLSIATMHYPYDSRRFYWTEVQSRVILYGWPDWESYGGHVVIRDWDREGPWPTAKRAWLSALRPVDATHHLVLQDDHWLCRDFVAAAIEIARLLPDEPVSFYSQRASDLERCRRDGFRWFLNPDGAMNGAVMMPVSLWEEALSWCEENVREDHPHDDERLALFLMSRKTPVYNTAPSLVQHLAPTESLVGHDNPTNVSPWFIGHHESALGIDWAQNGTAALLAPTNRDYAEEMAKWGRKS